MRAIDWFFRNTSSPTRAAIITLFGMAVSVAASFYVSYRVNLRMIPSVQRELKREDRRFDLLTEVATVSANYYQSIWNVFFSLRDREKPESRRTYREEMQKASAQAQGIYVKLSKLFDNKTIATEWKQLMEVYHSIYYPLGRGKLTTEEAVNQRLAEADCLRQSILGKMEDELAGKVEARP